MKIHPRNKTLKLSVIVNPGEGQTVSIYEWSLNNNIIPINEHTIILNTNDMPLGDNIISVRAQNSCGKWSDTINEEIVVIEGEGMDKIVSVIVDKPVTDLTIVMDFVGTVNVTVTDQLNRPVQGATVSVVGIEESSTTDVNGLAILSNIPYGTRDVKITI